MDTWVYREAPAHLRWWQLMDDWCFHEANCLTEHRYFTDSQMKEITGWRRALHIALKKEGEI